MADLSFINQSSFLETLFEMEKEFPTLLFVFSLIICILGFLGNLLVILVITVLKECKKSVTHWYVLQLAIADTIFLLTLPFNISEAINHRWIYPQWMCKAKETILFLNFYASILFLVVMSIDRYIAVCRTFSETLQKFRTQRSAAVISLAVWVISLLLCIPIMLYTFKEGVQPDCKCATVFPTPKKNFTAACIDDHFEGIYLDECVRIQEENYEQQTRSGEFYCKLAGNLLTETFNYGLSASDINITFEENYEDYFAGLPLDILEQGDGETGSDLVEDILIDKECHSWTQPDGWRAFVGFNFAVMFLLPFLVMLITYSLIVRRLFASSERTHSYSSNSGVSPAVAVDKQRKKTRRSHSPSSYNRRRITMMCASLVICFVACWLLFHAVHLAKINGIRLPLEEAHICKDLMTAGTMLAYVNAMLNPILYTFLGGNFTKRLSMAAKKSTQRQSSSATFSKNVRYSKKPRDRNASSNETVTMKITRNATTDAKAIETSSEVRQQAGMITRYQSDQIELASREPMVTVGEENSDKQAQAPIGF
ncbi:somatostatin receptor type 2-like isoform X2 [Clavelina lepadiformis]|uniref:somatostatin receptor type 2-like isoform X2 n=1 Tax=Clavelina lepadiformis TaxID=159417 RepID=UPI00404221D7